MAKLENGTWVLIADGEKALILENTTDDENPYLQVRREEHHENPQTGEQAANRPGRFNDGPGVARSAVEDTDWHRLEKERFADELAELLYKQAHKNKFDKIVIVAAPQVLGDLRGKLHKEVSDRVVEEVDKDLTNHPVEEIEKILSTA